LAVLGKTQIGNKNRLALLFPILEKIIVKVFATDSFIEDAYCIKVYLNLFIKCFFWYSLSDKNMYF